MLKLNFFSIITILTILISVIGSEENQKIDKVSNLNNDLSVICPSKDIQKIILLYFGSDEWQLVNQFNVAKGIQPNAISFALKCKYLIFGNFSGQIAFINIKTKESKAEEEIILSNFDVEPCNYLFYLADKDMDKLPLEILPHKDLKKIIKDYLKNERIVTVCGFDNNIISLFELNANEKIYSRKKMDTKPEFKACVAISNNGHYLASGSGVNIKIFDLELFNLIKTLDTGDNYAFDHNNRINCVCFSPCSKYITDGNCRGSIRIWDIFNEKCISKINLDYSKILYLSWSLNGKFIMASSLVNQNLFDVADIANPKCIKEIKEDYNHLSQIINIPQTNTIALMNRNRSGSLFKIWDISDSNNIKIDELQNRFNAIAIAASNDGQFLAIASETGAVEIWQNKYQYLLQKLLKIKN